jgi:hypothetical protein
MSERVPDPSVAHFGVDGMRRFTVPGDHEIRLPDSAREALEVTGVPRHVAPYFMASDGTEAPTLGTGAARYGIQVPAEIADWLLIGRDPLAQLCVRPDGAIQAVFLRQEEDDMFVSSSIPQFNASLTALHRRMPVIAASTSLPEAAAAFRELNAELRQIDPAAFEYRDSWWPRVLDDVRHTRPRVLMENETPTWTASTGHTSKTCENGTNSMVLTPE